LGNARQEADDPVTLLSRGLELYSQGKYKEAIEPLAQAIRLNGGITLAVKDPKWRDIVIKLAIAQSIIRDHSIAFSTFLVAIRDRQGDEMKEPIRLDTDSPEAYYALGTAYYVSHGRSNSGDYSMMAAIESFNGAIKLKPDYAEAYEYIGHCYNALHKYEQSIEYYHQALRLKPDLWMSYNGIGHNYAALKQYEEAIGYYREALDVFRRTYGEEHGGIIGSLATAYLDSGDNQSALEQYEILKRLCQKNDCRGIIDELEYLLMRKKLLSGRRRQ
jgi:tetratricopeptide (TPR) repeat protein